MSAVLLAALPARAQQLTLAIRDGRVTLDAHNVPVRQILTEWARIGGVKIVNGEKVSGPTVTLQLAGTPERQALDIILRGVSGYMLAARRTGAPGASTFDRILILPTSSAPRPATGQASAQPPNGFARPMAPPMALPAPQVEEEEDALNRDPVVADPRMPRGMPVPPGRPMPAGMQAQRPDPDDDTATSATPVAPTTRSNPFGVPTGSGRPGVIPPAAPGSAPGTVLQPQILDGAQTR